MGKRIKRNLTSPNVLIALLVLAISAFLLILSIIAIIYARGERPGVGGLVGTGNIRLDIDINDYVVYVNGDERKPQGKLLTSLLPGEYNLEIISPGYLTWQKTVIVRDNLVKEVYVNLIPEEPKPTVYNETDVSKVVFSTDGEYAYYVSADKNSQEGGIWRQKITESGPFNILSSSSPHRIVRTSAYLTEVLNANKYQIVPSNDNNQILLKITEPSIKNFILETDSTYTLASDSESLEDLIQFPLDQISWLDDSNSLFVQSSGLIAEFDIDSNETRVIDYSPESNLVHAIAEKRLYFYDKSKQVLKFYENHRIRELDLTENEIIGEITNLYAPSSEPEIIYYKNDLNDIYFLDVANDYQYEVKEISDITRVSPTGMGAIGTDDDGNFYSFVIEEIRALDQFEPNTSLLNFSDKKEEIVDTTETNPEIVKIVYSPNGYNIVLIIKDNKLYVSDRDGDNLYPILNHDEYVIVGNNYTVNATGTKLFVVLEKDGENIIHQVLLKLN